MKFYKQCLMEKAGVCETAWIPEEFAVGGKSLRLRGDDFWIVKEVYAPRQSAEYVVEYLRDDYRHQREASDI